MGFEHTIPAFERAKRVHASDSAATVIGLKFPTAEDYLMILRIL
jgi:hypothetical protein